MAAQPKPLPVHQPSYLEGGGILGWLTTIDHKRVAVMYLASALFFMAFGGFEAMAIRVQLWRPDNHALSAATYNAFFTMHGTTMVFLVVMPLLLGFFGNFLIPLQIGARDVAFPRLNALSFWLALIAGILLHLGWIRGGLPDAGWFGYANLTERYFTPGLAIDWWVIGLLVSGTSTVLTGLNFLTTIIAMRAPGMTYMRMPMFIWSLLVTSILILIAFPALTIGLIFLLFDRFFDTHFLHRIRGRDADSVAASVLAVRPSRSVHHGAAGLRNHLGSHPDVLAQAAVRLPDDGVFDLPDRIPVVRRVGTSHVRDGDGPGGRLGVRDHFDADRDSDRRENFQLDRDGLGRLAAHDDRILFRARDDSRVHDRRTQRNHARIGADRSAADRLVLRRRALSLRAVRRRDVRDHGGVLLLVAEDQRPHARRAAWQVALLADGRRLQPHVFPDAFSRDVGDAAAHLHLRRRHGLDASQPARDDRRVHSRHRVPAFLHQHFQKSRQRRARARRSVGRTQPRMVHAVAAARVQLRDDPANPRARRVVDSQIRARRIARRRSLHVGAGAVATAAESSRHPSSTSICRRRRFSRWC